MPHIQGQMPVLNVSWRNFVVRIPGFIFIERILGEKVPVSIIINQLSRSGTRAETVLGLNIIDYRSQ